MGIYYSTYYVDSLKTTVRDLKNYGKPEKGRKGDRRSSYINY